MSRSVAPERCRWWSTTWRRPPASSSIISSSSSMSSSGLGSTAAVCRKRQMARKSSGVPLLTRLNTVCPWRRSRNQTIAYQADT